MTMWSAVRMIWFMGHRIVILGGGTGGTLTANRLHRRYGDTAEIVVVDRDDRHVYQPGLLFVPFGLADPDGIVRSRGKQLHDGIEFRLAEVDRVELDANVVHLTDGGVLPYDVLVIASGAALLPGETEGLTGPGWGERVFAFYTLEGATALRDALRRFDGGRLVVNVVDMPIKCPVAPLEFTFLADAWLRARGLRDRVKIVYVTPLPGAFTKPVCSTALGDMLDERKIALETDFMLERIDVQSKALVSYDEREVPFDLLVTVPLNMGADFVARSGLGDELNYVPVDKHTLASKAHPNIFAVGDASDIPASKAGSVAHFSVEIFTDNFLQLVAGKPMTGSFDGHANCFIESGNGKGLLIDFNYDTEPLPGKYPLPLVGPLGLLKETRANHLGKLAFRWIYWNVLLPGHSLPVPTHMSMVGKTTTKTTTQ
jgi:sulfide:quinone oxidoreductase